MTTRRPAIAMKISRFARARSEALACISTRQCVTNRNTVTRPATMARRVRVDAASTSGAGMEETDAWRRTATVQYCTTTEVVTVCWCVIAPRRPRQPPRRRGGTAHSHWGSTAALVLPTALVLPPVPSGLHHQHGTAHCCTGADAAMPASTAV